MSEHSADYDATILPRLQGAERQVSDPLLAAVFRVAAMNVWAYGAPCASECDDLHCEYVRPILALATSVIPPAETVEPS